MRLLRVVFAGAAALVVVFTLVVPASGSPQALKPPVSTFSDATFGRVLSRRDKQVLYYWTVEKQAGGKVKCVGSCAVSWPPLIVKSRAAVPRRVVGISGTFGTVRRPDGRFQATRNGLALYTYAHERPRQVLCNDVNGWFVVRVR